MGIRPVAAGRPTISMREKTASASESLANNLAANGADIEVAVHGRTNGPPGLPRQGEMPLFGRFCRPNARPALGAAWLIILNHWRLSSAGLHPLDRYSMR